jgi:hypothetical protein
MKTNTISYLTCVKLCATLFLLICSLQKSFSQSPCPQCPSFLFITDTSGCQNGIDVSAFANYTNITPSFSNPMKACQNGLMKYVINDFTGCNYFTQPGSIIVTGGTLINTFQNTYTILWGNGSIGTVKFKINSGNSQYKCDSFATIHYALLTAPTANFAATPQPACFNSPTNINFDASTTINAATYFWTFGDGFTGTGIMPNHNYSSPGTYQVCLYASNFSANSSGGAVGGGTPCFTCVDSICKTIIIDALPAPPIACVATVCAGSTSTYTTAASSCSSYTWSVIGGTITNGQGTNSIQVTWGSGVPQGSISLITNGCSTIYCSQGNMVNVPIIGNALSISGSTLVCINSSNTYTLPTLPSTNYVWNISSPATLSPINTNSSSVSATFPNTGTFTLTASYFDTTLNCGGDTSLVIYAKPELVIKGNEKACVGNSSLLQSFFLNPINAQIPVACNWTILPSVGASIASGNGTASATFNWAIAGTYTITASSTTTSPPNVCNNATFVVTVNPLPVVSTINGNSFICPNSTSVYSATSSAAGQFTWTITGGFANVLNGNADSVQITWNPLGPYNISVVINAFTTNCVSLPLIKNVTPFPTPTLNGITSVCVDDTITYTLSGAVVGNYNWSITPSNLGTVITGQGTTTAQIKWHGDNTLNPSLSAYLHFGACDADSVLITINKPPSITIVSSGTLCSTGVMLSTNATSGNYSWSMVNQSILPIQNTLLSTITGLYNPGNYNIQIQNVNGTGCTINESFQIPDVGRPDAQIYTTGSTYYCLPALPNMTLNALTGAGYSYQWYLNGLPIGANASTLTVNSSLINIAGSFSFYCVVTAGLCKDTSSPIIIIVQVCTPAPACNGSFDVTSISNCQPFTLVLNPTSPVGATLSGASIFHYDDNTTIPGLTTKSYTTIGLKQFKVCAIVNGSGANCVFCRDTFATVSLAALFLMNNNCGIVTLTDQSTIIPPATISSYNWNVTDGSNNAVSIAIASFNNASIPNPILTISQSGTYIITQNVNASNGCNSTFSDTIIVALADASFVANDTCALSPILISGVGNNYSHYWDFGDASTSLTYPTSHAYATANTYTIIHAVANAVGCKDTFTQNININPNPTCVITYTGNTTMCQGDTLQLTACGGYLNYQWFKNGISISLANAASFNALQTGNYSFTALDANGCVVTSDTVNVVALAKPSTTFIASGSICDQEFFTISIPPCPGCAYTWLIDNVAYLPAVNANLISNYGGTSPFLVGNHWVKIIVNNGLCSVIDSVQIIVQPKPTISISVTGPLPVCSNNLYTFTASSNAALPTWVWSYSSQTISISNVAISSSAGSYKVIVKDGNTGCTNVDYTNIQESPDLSLFPIGCDLICDTDKLVIPLPSLNGNLSNYASINWYQSPNLITSIGSGISLPLSSLPSGNNQLAIIVINTNGCADTSTVYSLTTFDCSLPMDGFTINVIAYVSQKDNMIQWTTRDDGEVANYEIMKSADGHAFESIGQNNSTLNGQQNNSYLFADHTPFRTITYYKIKANKRNGQSVYSNIVALKNNFITENEISIYPNPTHDMLYFSGVMNAQLRDVTGKIILSKSNCKEINLAQVPQGLYYLSLSSKNASNKWTGKVIKE